MFAVLTFESSGNRSHACQHHDLSVWARTRITEADIESGIQQALRQDVPGVLRVRHAETGE
jgi:hypothetical protein